MIDNNDALAYFEEGNTLANLGKYEDAIICYDKAIESNNNFALAYNNKGDTLVILGKYEEALNCYDKAIELDNNFALAYYGKGVTLVDLGKYEEALNCFDKAIELDSNFAPAYFNKGVTLVGLGKYEEALNCYDKAIKLDNNDASSYYIKGVILERLGKYEEAINCYDRTIGLDNNFALAKKSKWIALQIEKRKNQNKDYTKIRKACGEVFSLIECDFFDEAIKNLPEPDDNYFDIYILSLRILKVLQITNNDYREMEVAHYTSLKVSRILCFDKKEIEKKDDTIKEKISIPFRLNSVTNSNDWQEGRTLFNSLFNNQNIIPLPEKFVAFVGCFMFNHDNLNQFRLYGNDRESKQEGTGISIVLNKNFFSMNDKSPFQLYQEKDAKNPSDDCKEPLFRCIYIDPNTNRVASIGHRDFHTFYKTKDILYNTSQKENRIKEIRKEIDEYKKEIDEIIKKVEGYLKELKDKIKEIEEERLDYKVIFDLLINLRYLVKHVAFKEEQECRIIEIKRFSDKDTNPPIDENHERFYVDYLPLANNVSKLYFGPKATGMELFQSLLSFQKGFENVACYRSTSPLA
jgi:tetratricopeptide (TPR) repeat protein